MIRMYVPNDVLLRDAGIAHDTLRHAYCCICGERPVTDHPVGPGRGMPVLSLCEGHAIQAHLGCLHLAMRETTVGDIISPALYFAVTDTSDAPGPADTDVWTEITGHITAHMREWADR